MKIKISIIFIIFSFFTFTGIVNSKENKILLKINNEIITSVDILQEIKYLSIINTEFSQTEKNQAIEIAKNSLIKEKIKRFELLKYFNEIAIDEKFLDDIIMSYFFKLNLKTFEEFEVYFKEKKIDTNQIKEKIAIEIMWNQLIYRKFFKNVKINENEIKKNLNNKKQKEYLLSEIVFNVNSNEKLEDKYKLIQKTINDKNFSQAALIHSISDTSRNGGKIDWIKESVLNKKIRSEIKEIDIGKFSEPIIVPGGFLILKIEDMRLTKASLNIEKEIKKIIKQQTNEQLNRYSNIYFLKVKKNIQINEL